MPKCIICWSLCCTRVLKTWRWYRIMWAIWWLLILLENMILKLCTHCCCKFTCIWVLWKQQEDLITLKNDDYFFGLIFSFDDAIMSTLKNELHVFQWLCVRPTKTKNPLVWWVAHVVQFPHVSFVFCQVFGIVGSHIETERVFNIVGVIMNLWQSWIGIDNLDCVILVVKKRLNEIHLKWTRAKEKTLEHLKTHWLRSTRSW